MKVPMETSEVKLEEKETGGSQTTFSLLIRNFCDYTSAHGLGRISAVKHWIRTVFWSLLFIGAVTMLCIQVNTLFQQYQSRPLTTLVSVKKETSLDFPAVTFCNFNALKNFSIQGNENSNLKGIVTDLHNLNESDWEESQINSTSEPRSERSSSTNYTSEIRHDDSYEDPGTLESRFLQGEKMAAYLAREDVRVLTLLGHQFDEMVLSCTYRGMSCRNYSTWFWTSFWHYKYGNCFVFNSGEVHGVAVNVFKSNHPGPSEGLNLEINIEQEEYIGPLTPEAGIRVDISPQGEMPFPLERGVSLAPGYATMIGLRKVITERKDPFKNKRCLETVDRDDNNLYTRLFNVSYSSTACKESCLAKSQLERCGCMEYRFPADGQKICSVTDIKSLSCLSKVQNLFKDSKLNCTKSCPPPCRLKEFKISTSFAIWPSEKYEPFYQESVEKKSKYLFTKSGSHRKNVLKLQVFYEDLDVDIISEQRSYELVAFVSDIGGQLGLWIGFSVLTVAEFLELIMLLCHLAIKKCSTKKTSVQNQQE